LALLGQALGADQLGVGVGGSPFREEDVVLDVGGYEVAHVAAEGGHLGLGGFCEGDGGEDGERSRGEADWFGFMDGQFTGCVSGSEEGRWLSQRATAADGEFPETKEGY